MPCVHEKRALHYGKNSIANFVELSWGIVGYDTSSLITLCFFDIMDSWIQRNTEYLPFVLHILQGGNNVSDRSKGR